MISLDFVGPLKKGPGGVRYIVTMVDNFSSLGQALAFAHATTKNALQDLTNWAATPGHPSLVLSDRASYFQSVEFKRWIRDRGGDIVLTAPHAHHSNGLNERRNQTLIGRIRQLLAEVRETGKKSSWTAVLQVAFKDINLTTNRTTGFNPVYVHLGRGRQGEAPGSQLQLDRVVEARRKKQEQERTANLRKGIPEFRPALGELVWVYDSVHMARSDAKFEPFGWGLIVSSSGVLIMSA